MSPSSLVWLITGTSTGIGRELALGALRRGEKVIATARARSLGLLGDLEAQGAAVMELDVTARLEELHKIAKKAVGIYGRVDVVVNNAGAHVAPGALEEISPEDTFTQFNLHVFGALNVARAFLPYMRERKFGFIVWIGSLMGMAGRPQLWYVRRDEACGSRAHVDVFGAGISETLDMEIQSLGVRSVCIEPGYFRSNLISSGHREPYLNRITNYESIITEVDDIMLALDKKQPGDSGKLADLIVDVVRQEGVASDKPFPTVLPVGPDCYDMVKTVCGEMQERLELWEAAIKATDVVVEEG